MLDKCSSVEHIPSPEHNSQTQDCMVHRRRILLAAAHGEVMDQNKARQERKTEVGGAGPWDGTGKPRVGRNSIGVRRMRASMGEAGAAAYGDIKVSGPSI